MMRTHYRNAQIAVAVTCAIATACFAGAVTEHALFGFVFPGIVLAGAGVVLLSSLFGDRSALIVSIGLALAWAEIANEATGTGNGPAARSTFAAAALTVLALSALATRMPALFLLPTGGIVVCAVLNGAGGEVPLIAAITGGAAVVTLAIVESAHRRWGSVGMSARAAQRSIAVVTLVAFAVAGVSSIAVLTQVHNDPRRPHPAIGIGNAVVHPVWGDPLLVHHHKRTHHTPHSVAPPPPAAARHHKPPAHRHSLSWALIVTLGLLLIAALAVAVRMWLVRRAWRRTQRRLGVEPPEGVIGAWIWATLRFRAYRIPLPPQLSPDRAYRGEAIHDVPPNTAEPLRQLGLLVTPIAFGSHDAIADAEAVDAAWRLSMSACAEAEGSLSRFGRLRLRLVSPPPIGVEGGN